MTYDPIIADALRIAKRRRYADGATVKPKTPEEEAAENNVGVSQPTPPIVQGQNQPNYTGFLQDLYRQNFGRAADQPGLDFWSQQMQGGVTAQDVASSFARSGEAQSFRGQDRNLPSQFVDTYKELAPLVDQYKIPNYYTPANAQGDFLPNLTPTSATPGLTPGSGSTYTPTTPMVTPTTSGERGENTSKPIEPWNPQIPTPDTATPPLNPDLITPGTTPGTADSGTTPPFGDSGTTPVNPIVWKPNIPASGMETPSLVPTLDQLSSGQVTIDPNDYSQFVTGLYNQYLNRTPDMEGRDYFLGSLQSGDMTPENVAAIIAVSPESQANQVGSLYQYLLGREADPEGLNFFQNAIKTGVGDINDVAEVLMQSPEYGAYLDKIFEADKSGFTLVNPYDFAATTLPKGPGKDGEYSVGYLDPNVWMQGENQDVLPTSFASSILSQGLGKDQQIPAGYIDPNVMLASGTNVADPYQFAATALKQGLGENGVYKPYIDASINAQKVNDLIGNMDPAKPENYVTGVYNALTGKNMDPAKAGELSAQLTAGNLTPAEIAALVAKQENVPLPPVRPNSFPAPSTPSDPSMAEKVVTGIGNFVTGAFDKLKGVANAVSERAAQALHPTAQADPKYDYEKRVAIEREAQRFGIDPQDLAEVMLFETIGSLNPNRQGVPDTRRGSQQAIKQGANPRYMGLIQFGAAEQKQFGITKNMTFDEQMKKVGDFLEANELGKWLKENPNATREEKKTALYSTINAGKPYRENWTKNDYNAGGSKTTVRQKAAQTHRDWGARAEKIMTSTPPIQAPLPPNKPIDLDNISGATPNTGGTPTTPGSTKHGDTTTPLTPPETEGSIEFAPGGNQGGAGDQSGSAAPVGTPGIDFGYIDSGTGNYVAPSDQAASNVSGYYTYEHKSVPIYHTVTSGGSSTPTGHVPGATALPNINVGGHPHQVLVGYKDTTVPVFHTGSAPVGTPESAIVHSPTHVASGSRGDVFGGSSSGDILSDIFAGAGDIFGSTPTWSGSDQSYWASINPDWDPVNKAWMDLMGYGDPRDSPWAARGGVIKSAMEPDHEDVENALRLAKAKLGGRKVNAKIDKDPAFDMSLKKGGGAWTRKEGQNPKGGLNAKGRASAKAEGHNLKPPAPHPKTDSDAARRKSFCARMSGMKSKLTSSKTANDPDSRINKSLRAWNCADGGEVWDKTRPKDLGKPEPLSKGQKKSAKAAAKAAGRPYPNLVDNMRAAQRKK